MIPLMSSVQQATVDRASAPASALSLLSLAASQARPQPSSIPRAAPTTSVSSGLLASPDPSTPATTFASTMIQPVQVKSPSLGLSRPSGNATGSQSKHRRLSSTSQSRRRVQDATAATIQATVARGTSVVTSKSAGQKSPTIDDDMEEDDGKVANAKRKGTIYRCETCSKVYRHPNCLLKHRWEHSPHWREASKFLLSKHQQVQLLEAAAILSHITPKDMDGVSHGTSLPEDRALWPSYLSGGVLPAPSTKTPATTIRSSNLASRIKNAPVPATVPKREPSSEEERAIAPSFSKDSGYSSGPAGSGTGSGDVSSSSIPATNGFSHGPVAMNARSKSDQTGTRSTGAPISPDPSSGVFYYGSVDAITNIPSFTQNGTTSTRIHTASQSLQTSYLSHPRLDIPPYARSAAPAQSRTKNGIHRGHGRTSSSISSSYTRSSVRGGAEDDDEDDDDDNMDDIGYISPVSPVFGSATSGAGIGINLGALALSPNFDAHSYPVAINGVEKGANQVTTRSRRRAANSRNDDLDFDVLYEKDEVAVDGDGEQGDDTVDEDSTDDRNPSTGDAGMEIDMDL